jgi:hypothetical protein
MKLQLREIPAAMRDFIMQKLKNEIPLLAKNKKAFAIHEGSFNRGIQSIVL